MGRGYPPESRERVKELLEQGRSEEEIEQETAVSDRTIRRWKLELERFGRIGKPPESRTGRHRVLGPDVEQALFDQVALKPEMTVDDMLWWLYDQHKLVVGTRTIRRAFERRKTSHKKFRDDVQREMRNTNDTHSPLSASDGDLDQHTHMNPTMGVYQSPYAPIPPSGNNTISSEISPELARALSGLAQGGNDHIHADLTPEDEQLSEDEESLQLQLQQIALQKREIELKLKMRRLQKGRLGSSTSRLSAEQDSSFMSDVNAAIGLSDNGSPGDASATPKAKARDSRSKNKIEEAKRRTEERQERMLKDLEKRSRRREHFTADWVQSKDIWPTRAQNLLTDLMHQYGVYAYNQTSVDSFEIIFRELYQLVDHSDWYPPVHDDLLRERTRRKIAQLRSRMIKSGEIVSRPEGYGGWTKPDDGGMAMQQAVAEQSLHSLPDMHLDMDMHAGAERDVDDTDPMAGPSPYPQQGHQHEHDLLDQQDLSHAHAQALMNQPGVMQRDVYTHHDLARQHELLAQQGMAQQEQMAQTQTLEQDLSQAIAAHHDEMVL